MRVAKILIEPAAKILLVDRRRRKDATLPLADLINLKLTDDYKRRKLHREIEAIVDSVAQRFEMLIASEWRDLPSNEANAALGAVCDTLESADLADRALLTSAGEPVEFARKLRNELQSAGHTVGLSSNAKMLYRRILDESCVVFFQLVVHLPSFVPRGIAELLASTARLDEKLSSLLENIPSRSLEAPEGESLDSAFQARYATYIANVLDEIDLFGVDVRRFRPSANLTVAYISLAVSVEGRSDSMAEHEDLHNGRIERDSERRSEALLRVEAALSGGKRVLIRGEAGSGKTTLLQWLAVNAARSSFRSSLSHWNGLTPFLIKLRSHAGQKLPKPEGFLEGVADPIVELMPKGWVHRKLGAGKALLLVDGVDELALNERKNVREWIRALLRAYPDVTVVVTSRPAAAAPKWLVEEQFISTQLEKMTSNDVKELIRHWHEAMRDAGNLPCSSSDLPKYERALLAQLELSPHLRGIATSPLLCAMLCALNLDRRTALPRDRMSIYAAALDLLLDRRDAERGIEAGEMKLVDTRSKIALLQYIAWRSSLNGRVELSKADAVRRVQERLAGTSLADLDASTVLDHMIHRSGIVREPVVGRVDFVHRTFQEYLTGREAAEQGDVGFLVDKAHLDTWRETIILAAGHANRPTRHELVTGLIDRAEKERRVARKLHLLVAACLETMGPIEPALRARIEAKFSSLLPPRKINEARSVAVIRDLLLRKAPRDLRAMSAAKAQSMVNAVALAGGPEAIDLLAGYAKTSPMLVYNDLVQMCRYFDPVVYGQKVLYHIRNIVPNIWVTDRHELDAWRHTPEHPPFDYIGLEDVRDLQSELELVDSVRKLWLNGAIDDLSPLFKFKHLEDLTFWSTRMIDRRQLAQLTNIKSLVPSQSEPWDKIDYLRSLTNLEKFWLVQTENVSDYSPLEALEKLADLRLYRGTDDSVLVHLAKLPTLKKLELFGFAPRGGFRRLARTLPDLESISLYDFDTRGGLPPLWYFERLKDLRLGMGKSLRNLKGIARLANLEVLRLDSQAYDELGEVAKLPNLKEVHIGPLGDFDVAPLRGTQAKIYGPGGKIIHLN